MLKHIQRGGSSGRGVVHPYVSGSATPLCIARLAVALSLQLTFNITKGQPKIERRKSDNAVVLGKFYTPHSARTLSEPFSGTPEPGARKVQSPDTQSVTPIFGHTPSDTLTDTSGLKGPRDWRRLSSEGEIVRRMTRNVSEQLQPVFCYIMFLTGTVSSTNYKALSQRELAVMATRSTRSTCVSSVECCRSLAITQSRYTV